MSAADHTRLPRNCSVLPSKLPHKWGMKPHTDFWFSRGATRMTAEAIRNCTKG